MIWERFKFKVKLNLVSTRGFFYSIEILKDWTLLRSFLDQVSSIFLPLFFLFSFFFFIHYQIPVETEKCSMLSSPRLSKPALPELVQSGLEQTV